MWMLPLYSLRFIASPLSYTFYIVDKQHVDLAWQVGLLVMTVATLNITSTSDVVLRTYAYSYSALYLIYIYLSYRCSLSVSLACRSEEHTSELQSLMRISYAVFCLTQYKTQTTSSLS